MFPRTKQPNPATHGFESQPLYPTIADHRNMTNPVLAELQASIITLRTLAMSFQVRIGLIDKTFPEVNLADIDDYAPTTRYGYVQSNFGDTTTALVADGILFTRYVRNPLTDKAQRLKLSTQNEPILFSQRTYNEDIQCVGEPSFILQGDSEIAKNHKAVIAILGIERELVMRSLLAAPVSTER